MSSTSNIYQCRMHRTLEIYSHAFVRAQEFSSSCKTTDIIEKL